MHVRPAFLAEAQPVKFPAAHLDWRVKALSVFVVLTNVLGNFFLSWGLKHQVAALETSPLAYLRLLFSPWVLVGIILLIFWLLSRMTLLGWADLSYVLPVTSIGYVLTAILGRFFFAERISPDRWLGTLLIVAGIILVGLTLPNTTAAAGNPRPVR